MSGSRHKIRDVTGGRRALGDHIDKMRADQAALRSEYRVDMLLSQSPKKKVKVAGIFVYQIYKTTDVSERLERIKAGIPHDEGGEFEMVGEPLKIADPDGRNVEGILTAFFATIDKYGGKADSRIVVPNLKIEAVMTAPKLSQRSEARQLAHKVITEAWRLFDEGFTWDRKERELTRFRGRNPFQTPITVGSTSSSD